MLNNLNKEDLLDIIIFIQNYCKIKIDPKFTKLTHYILKVSKNKKEFNEYLLSLKKKLQANVISQKNKNNIQENDDSDDSIDCSNMTNGIKINNNKIFYF